MAIPIHFLSVVLRRAALEQLGAEGQASVQSLLSWIPEWRQEDRYLLGTSFMIPADVRRFGAILEETTGLMRIRDWIVVDMNTGPTSNVHWVNFAGGVASLGGGSAVGHIDDEEVACIWDPLQLPVPNRTLFFTGRVVKLFGRDCSHDPDEHRQDFNRYLPDWGGKDLYQAEYGPGLDEEGNAYNGGYVCTEAHPGQFAALVKRAISTYRQQELA